MLHCAARWLRERQAKGMMGWRWDKPRYWLPDLLRLHWNGLKNVLRWAPVIYRDADWDYDSLLAVLEYKLRRMAAYHATFGVSHNRERVVRQLSVAAALVHRLREDDYFRMAGYDPATWPGLSHAQRVQIMDKETLLQRRDSELLGRLLGRHVLDWWD